MAPFTKILVLIFDVSHSGTQNILNERHSNVNQWPYQGSGRVEQSVGHLTRVRGPGFDTRSCHILSFLLSLIPEGQLSVTSESMCTKYWLTA